MSKTPPPDQPERIRAVDPSGSILVQAPAGSGKTTLLAERFLSLLAEVDEPGQVVAITFTTAAAAEMRNRILDHLRAPEPSPLALRVLHRSEAGGWNLLDLPAQLRISTIDAFCREVALQQPLLSGLGGSLDIAEQPDDLYRRAARRTMEQIDGENQPVSNAIADLLLWRDNHWQEVEGKLVEMLAKRDRWMQDFVLDRQPDWPALRTRLERPFVHANREALTRLSQMLDQVAGARQEALDLARFACQQPLGQQHFGLAELAEFPAAPFAETAELEDAREAFAGLANLILTRDGGFRKKIDKNHGFPANFKLEKARLLKLIEDLRTVPGCEEEFISLRDLPPLRYSEDEWKIVKACFTLLGQAAAELQVVFAETARVDYVEVAQVAGRALREEEDLFSETALNFADGIRHLLVDEFQDTSRRQHGLLAALISAWSEQSGRTLFAVGDPMQSIYSFRDAEAELFTRVRRVGLEIPHGEPVQLGFVPLTSNFRTIPTLVRRLNDVFVEVFNVTDTNKEPFTPSNPALVSPGSELAIVDPGPDPSFHLHVNFELRATSAEASAPEGTRLEDAAREGRTAELVELVQSYTDRVLAARARGEKYRIAVLARTKRVLAGVAESLREAGVRFRAVELEGLGSRPEILDGVGLGRALMNPYDRVAWLGVLRAPWCGLTLEDLYRLTSDDDPAILARPVPELLEERIGHLSGDGRSATRRVLEALHAATRLRAQQPTAALGTWLQQVWRRLGGEACVDEAARANLDLLWSCLDGLPEGEQDLIGPALPAALARLTALPDPEADSACGVQLMTIHKSKGLEFEVVIVPEMQARTRNRRPEMLSWLERGLTKPDDSGAISEFLVAPQQSKGADRGNAKQWVDAVREERQQEEEKRVFYVAATRARNELHLFARPACREDKNGELALSEPKDSLLAAAWPALKGEIEGRFEVWKEQRKAEQEVASGELGSLAASADTNLLVMASQPKPTILRRLPPAYRASEAETLDASSSTSVSGLGARRLYERHEGGLESRALGTAVHSLLEEMAKQRISSDWRQIRANLAQFEGRIAAQMRGVGVDPRQAGRLAAEAVRLALDASHDPSGQWILSPRREAASEARWAGVVGGAITNVRVDRVFRAGLTPGSEGDEAWWIIDYKTAHAEAPDPAAALPELRARFAPQVEAYARLVRNLHGADAVLRAGLYYPRMGLLDWWELKP